MKIILLLFFFLRPTEAAAELSKVRYKKQFLDYGSSFQNELNDDGGGGIGEVGGGYDNLLNGNSNMLDFQPQNSFGELGASRNSVSSMEGVEGFSDLASFINQEGSQSSPDGSQNTAVGLADSSSSDFPSSLPSFNGIIDGDENTISDGAAANSNNDILSSYNDDPFEKKLENNVNLGDTMMAASYGGGGGQSDPTSSSYKNNNNNNDNKDPGTLGSIEKILSNSEYNAPPSIQQHHQGHHYNSGDNKHNTGDGREGIGTKIEDMQDLLQNELGQLDTADEKLQKMLESGIDSDSSNFAEGSAPTGNISPTMDMTGAQSTEMPPDGGGSDSNMMNSLQSQVSQLENQYSDGSQSSYQQPNSNNNDENNYQDDAGGFSSNSDELLQQQNALNQMSGTMQQNSMEGIQPITIHAHASDKSSKQTQQQASPEASQKIANQVQEDAKKSHEHKLVKLKTRLKILRQKLSQLEDEQAKKSTSNTNEESPKASRNNAIKSLLIKNLKLAAMIASKEIQLEEARGRSLDYMSRKKEDNLKDEAEEEKNNNKSSDKHSNSKKKNNSATSSQQQPITELSRKAEEEVNHLTKNAESLSGAKKSTNKTLINSTTSIITKDPPEITEQSLKNLKDNNNNQLGTLNRINETLQILDKSGETVSSFKNDSSSNLLFANSSRRFLETLKTKVDSMPSLKAQDVEEKALESLYKAIKVKSEQRAKKRSKFLRTYAYHDANVKNVTMSAFS